MLENQSITVTWHASDTYEVQYRGVIAQGDDLTVLKTMSGSVGWSTVAATADGGFAFAWTGCTTLGDGPIDTYISIQMFDASGSPTGEEFLIDNLGARICGL